MSLIYDLADEQAKVARLSAALIAAGVHPDTVAMIARG